jgi:hypothetical protein
LELINLGKNFFLICQKVKNMLGINYWVSQTFTFLKNKKGEGAMNKRGDFLSAKNSEKPPRVKRRRRSMRKRRQAERLQAVISRAMYQSSRLGAQPSPA